MAPNDNSTAKWIHLAGYATQVSVREGVFIQPRAGVIPDEIDHAGSIRTYEAFAVIPLLGVGSTLGNQNAIRG